MEPLNGRIPRDQNRVPVLAGVSSADGITITEVEINPATGGLLTESVDTASTSTFPDSNVLNDDIFDNGLCGWEEVNIPIPFTWTTNMMPLTLGTDGNFGAYAMRLTTANVAVNSYAGAAYAMKRMTHQTGVKTNKGILKAEYWFTYGSDGSDSEWVANVTGATYARINGVYYVTLTVSQMTYLGVGSFINIASLGGLTNCNGTNGQAIISSISTNTITYPINAVPSGTYTSGGTVTVLHDFCAPAKIVFNIDAQLNTNSTTGFPRTTGARTWFSATWYQSNQTSTQQPTYSGRWALSYGSGVVYGAAGYTSPFNNLFDNTGYFTDFPPNQNLRNLQYVAFTVDTVNGLWLSLQANDLTYDLTSIPNNGNAPLASVLAPNDPTYNLIDFSGGLNQFVAIDNLHSGGVGATYGTASWLELHRARMSYL